MPRPRQQPRQRARQWMTTAEYIASETEAQFQSWVLARAKEFNWLAYHTTFSIASARGWPDLVLVKPGHRVIYAELKRVGKKPTPEQQHWLDTLAAAAFTDVYVWRPTDRETVVQVLAAPASVVRARGAPHQLLVREERL